MCHQRSDIDMMHCSVLQHLVYSYVLEKMLVVIPSEADRKKVADAIRSAAKALGVPLCVAEAKVDFWPLSGFLRFTFQFYGTLSIYIGVEAQLYDDLKKRWQLCDDLSQCSSTGLEFCQMCASENRGVVSVGIKSLFVADYKHTTLEVR